MISHLILTAAFPIYSGNLTGCDYRAQAGLLNIGPGFWVEYEPPKYEMRDDWIKINGQTEWVVKASGGYERVNSQATTRTVKRRMLVSPATFTLKDMSGKAIGYYSANELRKYVCNVLDVNFPS